MSRVRLRSLLAALAASFAFCACDHSSSSSDSSGGGLIGEWEGVSLDEDGAYIFYDSVVREFRSDSTATSYELSRETGPGGNYRNESLNSFSWSVEGDRLRTVAISCKEKEVGGDWVDDEDCTPGEEEKMKFKIDGDFLIIFIPGSGGSVEADTLRRIL